MDIWEVKLGKNGGYYLMKKPEEISLLEVIRLFEGRNCTASLYFLKSIIKPVNTVKDEYICAIRHTFKDIRDYTF